MASPITPTGSENESTVTEDRFVDDVSWVTIHAHPDEGPERITYETDDGSTETLELQGIIIFGGPVLADDDVTLSGDSLTLDIKHDPSCVTIRF